MSDNENIAPTTTRTIEPGTLVTDETGHPFTYGGPAEHVGFTTTSYGAGRPVIHTELSNVAPFDQVPAAAQLDKKDPRISVTLDKAGRPNTWSGNWRSETTGTAFPRWHKTKRDGLEESARRLAIADWWANV
ncbi:hypothetical protein [Cryobacterium zhongshanensis]|uniref:Uncharacterized protein n=1 Tax=Cryobacterium zhongshanensis TaxID=2928153 RepID=A0AA41QY13_9MICO|nr:hypothetical protein [Cryobacterium zhongshanensis]MCI4659657.1 hypothetical protein [Cryobacterium zhongshanensis]